MSNMYLNWIEVYSSFTSIGSNTWLPCFGITQSFILYLLDYSNKSPCPTKELYTTHACKHLSPIGAEGVTITCMYGIFPKSKFLK